MKLYQIKRLVREIWADNSLTMGEKEAQTLVYYDVAQEPEERAKVREYLDSKFQTKTATPWTGKGCTEFNDTPTGIFHNPTPRS